MMCEGDEPGRCALWRGQVPRMMVQKALHRRGSARNSIADTVRVAE